MSLLYTILQEPLSDASSALYSSKALSVSSSAQRRLKSFRQEVRFVTSVRSDNQSSKAFVVLFASQYPFIIAA
ncbi:hypothetical protein HanIR_Chr12g0578311 [Helianthus annuus]|nr:hypothetical protein HanIR_Chr12g0578311 [Helianthus annuus]